MTFTGGKRDEINSWLEDNSDKIKKQVRKLRRTQALRRRTALFCAVVIANIGLATFFGYKQKPGVSRYLLGILSGNLLLYVAFYCTMKIKLRFCTKKKENVRYYLRVNISLM